MPKLKKGPKSTLTLAAIKARLYRGEHPEDFGGKYFGEGVFRTAWVVGRFVVKRKSNHCGHRFSKRRLRQELDALGIKLSPQWVVRRPRKRAVWVIQPRYRALNWPYWVQEKRNEAYQEHPTPLDVHCENLGYNTKGELVAFDY